MEGELLQLFPTPVGCLKPRLPTDVEISIIRQLCSDIDPNTGNLITKNKNILDVPELANLKADLTNTINDYFDSVYKPLSGVKLYITNSWCNINDTVDSYHHRHIHHNSILSGTYYLEAEPSDTITFVKGIEHKLALLTYPREDNVFSMVEYDCPVEKNLLVLFPSTLLHLVKPLKRQGTRVSMSFNTFATGEFGDKRNLTYLAL